MYEDLVRALRLNVKYRQADNALANASRAADAIESMCEMVATAYEENANIIQSYEDSKPQWIPVAERLPKGADESGEICENVWLLFDDGCVYPGWMNGTTKKVYFLDDMNDVVMRAPISRVRAWQPGPKSPKEET